MIHPLRLRKTLDHEPPPDLLARIAVHQELSRKGDPEGQ
jgi:hypothetical protein